MSIADEIRKLQELHRNGALTDTEFAQAKARVLAGQVDGAEGADAALRDHVAKLERENELARLDRDWDHERLVYQVSGRYGNRYTPSRAGALIGGLAVVGIGTVWTVMAASIGGGMGGPGLIFPLFGVGFVLFGVGIAVFTYRRASQYELGYRRYQRRRALLLLGEPDAAEGPAGFERPAPPPSTDIQDLSEPAPCLSCGRTIPAGQTRCPQCGWSYS